MGDVRRGRSRIMGPIDYSTNYACGLLVDGFDTPPRVMMNHHPPFYAGLLECWGLTKVKELARELGTTSRRIIDRCRAEGLAVQNSVTRLKPEVERVVRAWFSDEDGPATQ